MNLRRVAHILGFVLFVLAGAQLLPLVWCFWPTDWNSARAFLVGASITGMLGAGFRRLGAAKGELYRRDGVLIVVGAWFLASLTGAIPYVVSGAIPGLIDALFEATSGFTTTGASILTEIEKAERAILFWRNQTQWLGGIGIVVLFVALLSELGPGARFLFKLEVPGPKAEILHTRVQETATTLFRIYLALTVVQIALLLALGEGPYDAITLAFSTAASGGFSPYADSVGHFNSTVQLVVIVFMLAAAVNFSLYYAIAHRRDRVVLRDTELRFYLSLIAVSTLVVFIDNTEVFDRSMGKTALDAAFHVVSVVTTTGFVTADFDEWPDLSRALLVALMVFGGCAGSTAGGAKIVRLLVSWKAAVREVRLTFSPSSVIAIVVGKEVVPEESVRSVLGLVLLWGAAWAIGTVLLSVGEADIVTAATASIATVSNIGPGLGAVGPSGSYAFFADWQKLLMILFMWLGRLEFFALLALFLPQFWRR
ncbi:MAG: TrkH family potassium uptake protein [Myxococcales bacterium]|nr:TrkH family potassium uptake protein [Myxococcales bacterium]